MYYRLGRAGRALDRFGVIEFATTIAPGVRDVLLTGKVYEAVQRNSRNKGRSSTTPSCSTRRRPAGSRQFLNVSDELAGLAKVGPIKSQADTMMTLFRSPRTAVHFVTVLEEMPVQETADGIAHLREAGLPVGGVVVNQVRPRELRVKDVAAARKGELDRAAIGSDLVTAGVDVSDDLLDGLLDEARDHADPQGAGGCPAQAGQGDGRADVRAAPAGRRHRHGRPLRAGRRPPRPGDVMTRARSSSRPARGAHHGCAGARRRRAARRPGHRHHRLLRLGRRRQDHHVRRARAPGRRAGPQGRGAHHRPGPAAGAVDGHRGARQHPAAGHGRRRRRLARRDDARHEADLRRGRGGAGHPGEGEADPRQPVLHRAVRRRSPGRRSTWRWRSSASSSATPAWPTATT